MTSLNLYGFTTRDGGNFFRKVQKTFLFRSPPSGVSYRTMERDGYGHYARFAVSHSSRQHDTFKSQTSAHATHAAS